MLKTKEGNIYTFVFPSQLSHRLFPHVLQMQFKISIMSESRTSPFG